MNFFIIIRHFLLILCIICFTITDQSFAYDNFFLPHNKTRVLPDDRDQDGMPDWWELRFNGVSDINANQDPDQDGLINLEEFYNGTNPFDADSDADGLSDGQEVYQYGTDPMMADTDEAGQSDGYEVSSNSSPLDPDDDDKSNSMTITIHLKTGWNLISFSISPLIKAVDKVLSPVAGSYLSVWSYQDSKWLSYTPDTPELSNLSTLESGWGYWIKMKNAATLNISGTKAYETIHLKEGQNLVGYNKNVSQSFHIVFSSILDKISNVWMYIDGKWKIYDSQKPEISDLDVIDPQYGYWIRTTQACDWILP